jgi:hypothetical protein
MDEFDLDTSSMIGSIEEQEREYELKMYGIPIEKGEEESKDYERHSQMIVEQKIQEENTLGNDQQQTELPFIWCFVHKDHKKLFLNRDDANYYMCIKCLVQLKNKVINTDEILWIEDYCLE